MVERHLPLWLFLVLPIISFSDLGNIAFSLKRDAKIEYLKPQNKCFHFMLSTVKGAHV